MKLLPLDISNHTLELIRFNEIGVTDDRMEALDLSKVNKLAEYPLASPENKLLLINTVNSRYSLSILHQSMLQNLKGDTEFLLDKLNDLKD